MARRERRGKADSHSVRRFERGDIEYVYIVHTYTYTGIGLVVKRLEFNCTIHVRSFATAHQAA